MPDAEPSRKIAVRRRGNRLGFWIFETSCRVFGLRGAYGLLYFVCAYYLLFDRAAVAAALAYIRRRFRDYGALRQRLAVYRLFISQGRSLIDRHVLLAGFGRFEMPFGGYEKIADLVADPKQGFVLLTAHVGTWQAMMTTLQRLKKSVCLVMRPEDNPAVQESLRVDGESETVRIVSPEQFLGGVPELVSLLQKGWIVSIMGDRSYGYNSLDVQFLGDPARFPCGAFHLAAVVGCPVVVLLSAKTGTWRYHVEIAAVYRPAFQPGSDKRGQLKDWVQEFARVLEQFVREYPYQCFLFHDVWNEQE
jgi:predicted LPLAT superfamily acyltransferase